MTFEQAYSSRTMSNVLSKSYSYPTTTTFKGQPSDSLSDTDSDSELHLPVLSHIIGTQQILTIDTDSE